MLLTTTVHDAFRLRFYFHLEISFVANRPFMTRVLPSNLVDYPYHTSLFYDSHEQQTLHNVHTDTIPHLIIHPDKTPQAGAW